MPIAEDRARLSVLRSGTCLSTPRISALLVALGLPCLAGPALAANFNVGSQSQLSNAIQNAANGDTITFTANIALNGPSAILPNITTNVAINGNGHTLSGTSGAVNGFYVQSGTVSISNLAFSGLTAQGGNGGTGWGGGGGGGGAGMGGAIYVAKGADVTLGNVSLMNNSARGGNGGAGNSGSSGTSGGGGGHGPTGANGGDANGASSGGGGTGGGGDGYIYSNGGVGGLGGGGGGSYYNGGVGGLGGGGGGSGSQYAAGGGLLGGAGGAGAYSYSQGGGGGGGAGLGGAIFVEDGGHLTVNGAVTFASNTVTGGAAGNGWPYIDAATAGGAAGSALFLAGNGTLTLDSAGKTQTITDSIADQTGSGGRGAKAGSWALVKNGAGTLILNGTNTYSGGTTVNSGVLQGNSDSIQGAILNNASVVFQQAGAGTYAGTMTGTGTLTKTGAGNLTLTGTNTYSGGTLINGGTLTVSSDANLGAAGRAVSLNNGATLNVNTPAVTTATFTRALTLTGDATLTTQQSLSQTTWDAIVGGSGHLTVSGAGTLNLVGANTYTGGTTVRNGNLAIVSDGNLGAAASAVNLQDGWLTVDTKTPFTTSRALRLSGTGTIDVANAPVVWGGTISGSGALAVAGLGVLQLTNTNTYSGGTLVSGAVLQVASDAQLGAAGTGIRLEDNGHLWATQSFTTNRDITLGMGSGGFQLGTGNTLTLTGAISGTALSLVGTGTLVLDGTSTYSNILNYGGTIEGNTDTLRGTIAFDPNAKNPNARSVTFNQASNGTFAGAITGIGSLTKTGAGTLILGGDNTYSGGTSVLQGTLQGTSKSLTGDIANAAALVFNQDFEGTYAGAISGNGTLTKDGTGKLYLSGASTVGGGTQINGGALSVNGHLTSNVTVNKGGTLNGSGNITGNITNNGGSIKPGNSIGHLTVDGDLALDSGTLEIEINNKGDSDQISVIGAGHKLTIISNTLLISPEAGIYTPNTTYAIIKTEGGGTVLFDTYEGGVGVMTPDVWISGDTIYMKLALAPDAFRAEGVTLNQRDVGAALDTAAAGGYVDGLVTDMANLSSGHVAPALQALSGQPYADFSTVNLRANQLFMNAVGRQMAVDRGALPGGTASAPLGASDGKGTARLSAWVSGIGGTGSVNGDMNAGDVDYSLGGTAFGIQYRVDPQILLGIAGGYVSGSQSVAGFAGNGSADTTSVVAYGSFTQGAFYADALAGYAYASNSLERVIAAPGLALGVANGDTSANQFIGQIETGYKLALPTAFASSISPFLRLQVAAIDQKGFTETGASLYNLSVASQSLTSARTTLGADFATRLDLNGVGALDLGLRLGWVHEFGDTAPSMTASFASIPVPQAFTAWGAGTTRDSALIGVSAAAKVTDNISLFASYDGEVGGGNTAQQVWGGLKLTW